MTDTHAWDAKAREGHHEGKHEDGEPRKARERPECARAAGEALVPVPPRRPSDHVSSESTVGRSSDTVGWICTASRSVVYGAFAYMVSTMA